MTATIVSIGNELLIGDTINTNAAWIGRFLTETGFTVEKIVTISDDYQTIIETVNDALESTSLVITTGGLGPTHDDITKRAVADLFNARLELNEEILGFIRESFKSRGIPFSKSNRDQALVPENCRILFNRRGTAPGLWFKRGSAALAILPGVPHEMKYLMEKGVLRQIRETFTRKENQFITYIRTSGVGESSLSDDCLGDLSAYLINHTRLAFLPGSEGVTLRISTRANDKAEADQQIKALYDHIYKHAGDHIYGEGRETTLSGVTGELLKTKGLSLSVAESCTGGLLSSTLTDIPGSSDYFIGAVIAYSNEIKQELLNVSASVIDRYGAVSMQTAIEMATGVRKLNSTDIAVSTTGIAGPGGGSDEKPVGYVWMGFSFPDDTFALNVRLTHDRLLNKRRTVTIVLDTLRRRLRGYSSYPYDLNPVRN